MFQTVYLKYLSRLLLFCSKDQPWHRQNCFPLSSLYFQYRSALLTSSTSIFQLPVVVFFLGFCFLDTRLMSTGVSKLRETSQVVIFLPSWLISWSSGFKWQSWHPCTRLQLWTYPRGWQIYFTYLSSCHLQSLRTEAHYWSDGCKGVLRADRHRIKTSLSFPRYIFLNHGEVPKYLIMEANIHYTNLKLEYLSWIRYLTRYFL